MRALMFCVIAVLSTTPAAAQNWSFDARRIALGGAGSTESAASRLVEEQRRYRSIVVPLGLIQVLTDLDVFNTGGDRFDPVRAMEYAASPLHYTIGRETNGAGSLFVADLVNAAISRDLNRYRGFVPARTMVGEWRRLAGARPSLSGDRRKAFIRVSTPARAHTFPFGLKPRSTRS